MSGWFSFNLQNEGCNCCNNGNSDGSFGGNLNGGFSMPGGIFSYTTYGMINGDYSFYNPVPPMSMFTFFPGGSLFNSPGGYSFDPNMFGNLLNLTCWQMNQQNFWNSINGSGNGAFGGNWGGFNFNTPFGNWGVGGGNGSGNSSSKTPEEKAAEEKYNTLKAFLDKYATYQDSEDLKNELKEIQNRKITEHDDETDKDKTRNATYAEKLAELQKLFNHIKTNRASQLEKFITSENSGLLAKGNGTGAKDKKESLTKQLEIIGYERKTAFDEYTSSIKTKLTTVTDSHGANIREAFGWFEDYEILDAVSSYNTNNGSSLMADIMKAYKATSSKPADQAIVKEGAMNLAEKLMTRADETKGLLNEKGQKEFAKLKKALNDKVTSNTFDQTFCNAFNKLYATMRTIETKYLLNELKGHYEKAVPGVFDFIAKRTEDDLNDEKAIDSSIIPDSRNWALDEGSDVPTVAGAEGTPDVSDLAGEEGREEDPAEEVNYTEELNNIAETYTNVTKGQRNDGKSSYYKITLPNGEKVTYSICAVTQKLIKLNYDTKKYEYTEDTIDDIKSMLEAAKAEATAFVSCLGNPDIIDGKEYYTVQDGSAQYVKLDDGYHRVLSSGKYEEKTTSPTTIQNTYDQQSFDKSVDRIVELFNGDGNIWGWVDDESWQELNAMLGMTEAYGRADAKQQVRKGVVSVINDDNILLFLDVCHPKAAPIKDATQSTTQILTNYIPLHMGMIPKPEDIGLFTMIYDQNSNDDKGILVDTLLDRINKKIDSIMNTGISEEQKLVLVKYKKKFLSYKNPKEFKTTKGKEIDDCVKKLIMYLKLNNIGGFTCDGKNYQYTTWAKTPMFIRQSLSLSA